MFWSRELHPTILAMLGKAALPNSPRHPTPAKVPPEFYKTKKKPAHPSRPRFVLYNAKTKTGVKATTVLVSVYYDTIEY